MMSRRAKLGIAALFASVLLIGFGSFALRQHLFDRAAMALKEGNYPGAASKLKFLAHVGDSSAQNLLGDLYAFGWGVQKKDDEAIKWYRRAGAAGEEVKDKAAPAMYFVGRKYLQGTGIARDEVEARKWFERSASGGYVKAAEELSKMSH